MDAPQSSMHPCGDFNGDGVVNIIDVSIVAVAFGSYPGHPMWNSGADLNNDGVVNMLDLRLVAEEMATGCTITQFLSVFHTGACLWHAYDQNDPAEWACWAPARQAHIIKGGLATQRTGTIKSDGSVTGSSNDAAILSKLQDCFSINYVPVIEFSRLTNWLLYDRSGPELTEEIMRKFFTKWGNWLKTNYPDKFFILSLACEFNYPEGIVSSNRRNVHWTTYNEKMKIIRKVRDDLGLQNKILLGMHANLGWWAYDSLSEVVSNFANEEKYYEGFAQNDIVGFSHYHGYKNTAHNPSGADWKTTVEYSWRRAKMIWEAVCARAGKTLPFLWMEYSIGNPWKYEQDKIWKEAVTYTYEQLVQKNKWCKGINWYIGSEMEPDAMQELVRLAEHYNGYGL